MTQAIVLWGCLCSMDKLALHCAGLPQVLQTSGSLASSPALQPQTLRVRGVAQRCPACFCLPVEVVEPQAQSR